MHPLKNPNAPPDPSYLPQYRIPQAAQGQALAAEADAYFTKGESAAATADKYVRITVFLAAVLFLIGIGSRFPLPSARYGLTAVASVLLVIGWCSSWACPVRHVVSERTTRNPPVTSARGFTCRPLEMCASLHTGRFSVTLQSPHLSAGKAARGVSQPSPSRFLYRTCLNLKERHMCRWLVTRAYRFWWSGRCMRRLTR